MFTQALNCLEDSTMSNPVHTSETRMCGDIVPIPSYCLPGRKCSCCLLSEGILSFVEYAPRLLIVLSSRQFRVCDCLADEHSE